MLFSVFIIRHYDGHFLGQNLLILYITQYITECYNNDKKDIYATI